MSKVRGSGRKAGVPDKRTMMLREGMQSALDLLREKDKDGNPLNPITYQKEINAILRAIIFLKAAGNVPAGERTAQLLAQRIVRLPIVQQRLMLEYLKALQDGWYKLTQFAYPKLAQVDVKDMMMSELLGAAAESGVQVEYTRHIIVRPDGQQVEQRPFKVIDGGKGNGKG
jgi:hypothetical protein